MPMAATRPPKVARPQRRDLLLPGRRHRRQSIHVGQARGYRDVIIGLIKLFSWDVDFQRDVRRGDQFETLFEVVSLEDGSADTRGGDLVSGRCRSTAACSKATASSCPTAGSPTSTGPARACASFCCAPRWTARGCRRASACAGTDPRLYLMHKVDFAAPQGSHLRRRRGRVEVANRHGGYGKYIRIRHTGEYSMRPSVRSPKASRPAGASVRGR